MGRMDVYFEGNGIGVKMDVSQFPIIVHSTKVLKLSMKLMLLKELMRKRCMIVKSTNHGDLCQDSNDSIQKILLITLIFINIQI